MTLAKDKIWGAKRWFSLIAFNRWKRIP